MDLSTQWQEIQGKRVRCQAHTQQALGQVKGSGTRGMNTRQYAIKRY